MKIGIIGSGYDMIPLFTLLQTSDHEFHVFTDVSHGPRPEKSLILQEERIAKGIVYLREQGVQKIIVPVRYELAYGKDHSDIIPLFATYLQEIVLPSSTVGKIGCIGFGSADSMQAVQQLLERATTGYIPTQRQERTRVFQRPFAWWMGSAELVLQMLPSWSSSDRMVRKRMKQSLRYFQDAAVDTLLPCDWGFLAIDALMRTLCRERKVTYHARSSVDSVWQKLTASWETSAYSVRIHTTDTVSSSASLLFPKKWERLLSRGKKTPLTYIQAEV